LDGGSSRDRWRPPVVLCPSSAAAAVAAKLAQPLDGELQLCPGRTHHDGAFSAVKSDARVLQRQLEMYGIEPTLRYGLAVWRSGN